MSYIPSALKILIVENHPDTLRYIKDYIQLMGHEVHIASDKTSALKILSNSSLDVLISDIHLPDGDGWELMKKAKELQPRLFGIAMSGLGSKADCKQSHSAGFQQHLAKPFLPEDLEALLLEAAKSLPLVASKIRLPIQ
ncbi:MAG: response regulator [Chthoniobacterales bacterium]